MVIHSTPEFNILVFINFITIHVYEATHGYEIQCPDTVHWNVRAKDLCIVELKYLCLYDDVKANTTESCNGPLPTIAKGYKWVIRGNPDRGKCSLGTYQPYEHRNVKASACVYQKSLCSEEGQVVFDMGNTIHDQKCRCDYTRGYDFVGKPRNRCYCYPSTEDCSCFLRRCDITGVRLSQDYECIDNYNTTTICPKIVTILDSGLQPEIVTKQKDIKLDEDNYKTLDVQRKLLKIILKILILCTPLAVPTIVLVVIQIHTCIHRPLFVKHLRDTSCFEGDREVTLLCELAREEENPCWSTDSNIQLSNESKIQYGNIYKIIIKDVQKEHSGQYTINIRGIKSTAVLTVKALFVEHLRDTSCFEGDREVTLLCKLAHEEENLCWSTDSNIQLSDESKIQFGNIYKIIIKDVQKEHSGTYTINIRGIKSTAVLTVKEYFLERLAHQTCVNGESYQISCITAGEFIIPAWYKNGEEIVDCDNIKLSSVPQIEMGKNVYRLTILSFNFEMQGKYKLKLAHRKSSAYIRPIEDIFSFHLISQTCFFGEDVKFECTLTVDDKSSIWFKDKNEYELPCHWQTTYTLRKHALMITAVSFKDEGRYSIKVRNVISGARLVVRDELSIKTEDINYLLSVYAISNIATPAVRDVFDKEFSPHDLSKTLRINIGTLHQLKRQKHINLEEWNLLFDHRKGSTLNSAQFNLRLMVLLLRNIASFDIENSLPEPTNTSKDADLSRINYYRNLIAHNHGKMSNDDLVQSVKDLMEVAKRLKGTPMNSSPVAKKQQLWTDHFDSPDQLTQTVKALLERKPKDIPEIVRKISTEERDFLQIVFLLHKVACPAVRLKFNTIFHPSELKQTLKDYKQELTDLKDQKRITPSQWDLLFPNNDKTSSTDFGLKLMLILLSNLKPLAVTDEEMQALKSLESYLYTVARRNSGQVSKDNFEDYCKDICSAIILIGGDSYGKRFTNICCSLHIDVKIKEYLKTLCSE